MLVDYIEEDRSQNFGVQLTEKKFQVRKKLFPNLELLERYFRTSFQRMIQSATFSSKIAC